MYLLNLKSNITHKLIILPVNQFIMINIGRIYWHPKNFHMIIMDKSLWDIV